MKNNNSRGFGAVEGIILLAVVVLLGVVGYVVYKNLNKAADTYKPADTKQSVQTTTTKSASLGTASYTLELPSGWTFKEIPTADANEKLAYVIDPTNTLQLEVQLLSSTATSGSTSSGLTSLRSFMGVSGKTYYVHGYKGNSTVADAYEVLQLSECSDKHCYTKITDDGSLNLAIRGADFSVPTKANNAIIGDMITIIQSIKLYTGTNTL